MAISFIASYEFVVGHGTIIPGTGIRDSSKTSDDLKLLATKIDNVIKQKIPAGNAVLLMAEIRNTLFIIPQLPPAINFAPLLITSIGNTADQAHSQFVSSSGIPPTPSQVQAFYYASSLLPRNQQLDVTVIRYITSIFLNGEG